MRESDLKAVRRTGNSRRTSKLDISWRPNDLGHPRLGVVVPRYGATAVSRNNLRRRLRECSRRRILPQLADIDLVIRARPSAYRAHPRDLTDELEQWLASFSA
ncbi:MAG: ribonuclease P protein component [Gemmatimonadetes bacterium]|nr:ribonuclease P protein component [Gemmatimonadota bacterium]MCH7714609.1 ribonuclease P protein component [Gemmatimonadota bacterium]